jgi:predicted metal-dependent hydrolase
MTPPDQLSLPFALPAPGQARQLKAPAGSAPAASPAIVPTPRPASLPKGAQWREVQTALQPIGFVLQRSKRKTIGLVINDDGLQITAPKWVTLRQIDDTIAEKMRWILAKLKQRQARQEQLATADAQWRGGGHFPYLGKRTYIELGSLNGQATYRGDDMAPQNGGILRLPLPADADRNRIRDSVHGWLQKQARALFEQRLIHFQEASGLKVNRWRLSSAATRWGSCNSDGNIMLNWRLIHFQPDIIDYVVVHEIAHLREMNHSHDFWREVERILPGFQHARGILRQHDPDSLPLI